MGLEPCSADCPTGTLTTPPRLKPKLKIGLKSWFVANWKKRREWWISLLLLHQSETRELVCVCVRVCVWERERERERMEEKERKILSKTKTKRLCSCHLRILAHLLAAHTNRATRTYTHTLSLSLRQSERERERERESEREMRWKRSEVINMKTWMKNLEKTYEKNSKSYFNKKKFWLKIFSNSIKLNGGFWIRFGLLWTFSLRLSGFGKKICLH